MVDGWPRSWRDFVYGMRTLARERAAESLRIASAYQMGSGFTKPEAAREWFAIQRKVAGW